MSRKLWLGVLHLFCAGLIGLPVFGATQTWSDQVTLTEDVTDDVELDGEVAVTVASDSTVTVFGAISDKAGTNGRIKLIGGGTLVLTTANTFSGGAYVDTGVLQVTCAGALGDGAITVKGGTSVDSKLQFNFSAIKSKGTITYTNDIVVENGGDANHYQLQFGPHYDDSAHKNDRQTLNLTGDITCGGDLYMSLNNGWSNAAEPNLYLNNVSVNGKFYLDQPAIDVYIQGKFVAKDLDCGKKGNQQARLSSPENQLDRISFSIGGVECLSANVLGGAAMAYSYRATMAPKLTMNGYSQTAAYLSTDNSYNTDAKRKYLPQVTATGSATLTLTGGIEQATFEGSIGNNVSLAVNAQEGSVFEQILTGNLATMDGLITVNHGKLTISNAATIPTDGILAFNLGEHGMIDLGGRSYTAKSVTINGIEQRNTMLTHETHPNNIAEGTVVTVGRVGMRLFVR